MPLRGRYAILAERKDNFFMDVVCGRGDCAGMTYVITSTGLICQFDEQRQMQAEQDLQVRCTTKDHRTSLSSRLLKEKTSCLAISDTYLAVGCVKGAVYVFSPQTLDYLMSIPLPHHLGVDLALTNSTEYDRLTLISSLEQFFLLVKWNEDQRTSLFRIQSPFVSMKIVRWFVCTQTSTVVDWSLMHFLVNLFLQWS